MRRPLKWVRRRWYGILCALLAVDALVPAVLASAGVRLATWQVWTWQLCFISFVWNTWFWRRRYQRLSESSEQLLTTLREIGIGVGPRWRAVLAAAVAVVVLAVLQLTSGLPANAPAAHPWRYPCREHLAGGFEWFTPARAFWDGRCQQ